jgi:putative transposase
MLVQKSVKVRIYPRESDKELLAKHFGTRRWLYNHFLSLQNERYHKGEKHLSYISAAAVLKELKGNEETKWLKEINSQSNQWAIKDLCTAFDRFFRKKSKFPRYKSRKDNRHSFKVPQHFDVNWDEMTLKIPKFRPFKMRGQFKGECVKVNSITISKTPSGKYFASIQGEFEIEQKVSTGECVGVDLGIKDLIIDSNGRTHPNQRFLRRALKNLKFLQRRHSKTKKDSAGRERARIKLAIAHEKVVNQRTNYLHQITSQLIDENQVICVEDLNVKGMVKNHCLAQAVSDVSWGTLIAQLKYKAQWHDREIQVIDRWYPSSKTCSVCSHQVDKMPLNIREWDCPSCGTHHDRDINAAMNILIQGLNQRSGCGTQSDSKQKQVEASSIEESMKPETEQALASR